jgi:hypothetical protein
MHAEYPKWICAPDGHHGHPQNPGKVLVENEGQELAVLAGGDPPAELNPAADPKPEGHSTEITASTIDLNKPIEDMNRAELVAALVQESITADVTDDQLRDSLRRLREHKEDAPGEPLKDAEGKEVPPPVDQEANKGKDLGEEGRTLPEAKSQTATDARPDDAKAKEADDKPAGNITEAAATPPDHKKGTRQPRHTAKD